MIDTLSFDRVFFLIYMNRVRRYTDCCRDGCLGLISTRPCIRIARLPAFYFDISYIDISTRPCIQIARGWDTFPALSDLVPPFLQTSFGGPFRRHTPRGFALCEVSCWTYFLPGFCRAVPVISTPALLSLGKSKRTRLCCYPILRRGAFF